jgi:hypothetical protein
VLRGSWNLSGSSDVRSMANDHPLTREILVLVVAVLAASLFVRLYGLDKQGLECDELFTIGAANGQHYVYFSSQSKYSVIKIFRESRMRK